MSKTKDTVTDTPSTRLSRVAEEVANRRPDLASAAAGDCIAAVLTEDPTLTADEVIEILDESAADYALDIEAMEPET